MPKVLKNDTSRNGIAQEHGAPKLLVHGGKSDEVRMSRKTCCVVATLLIGALVAPVGLAASDYSAGGSAYIGGSIGNFSYRTGDQEKLSPKIGLVRVGVQLNPYLAIEGRYGAGLSTEFTTLLGGYDLQIDSLYGGYLKGNVPLSPSASLYGLAGYSAINLRRNFKLLSNERVTDDGASFAGGLDVNLRRNLRLNVEWGRFIRVDRPIDSYRADILSIGLVWLL
jgi:outer membrane immunogenic protein